MLAWDQGIRTSNTAAGICAPRLLRLDTGVSDHLAPLVQLDLDEVPELLGRAGKRLEAGVAEFRFDVRIIDDLAQLLIELRHDRRRRMRRRDDQIGRASCRGKRLDRGSWR